MELKSSVRPVSSLRITQKNDAPVRKDGEYVLYWMIATRRTRRNFGLQRAVEWCVRLGRPLVVLEPLRIGYPHASDRLHRFVIDGMRDNAEAFAGAGSVLYVPYVEPNAGAGKGLLDALARRACVVVTDEFPSYFLPRMVDAASKQLGVRLEAVDSNGVVPLRAPGRAFTFAHSFRAWQRKHLEPFLASRPEEDPLSALTDLPPAPALPREIRARWPAPTAGVLAGNLSALEIDHAVPPVAFAGGARAAAKRLREFVGGDDTARYDEDRNHPDRGGTSGLSPWLHFGHLSSFDVIAAIESANHVSRARAFIDQLVTWREIGLNFSFHHPDDHDRFSSLPEWARETLEKHRKDTRPAHYDRAQLEAGTTGDRVWNAAQRELRATGVIHNRLRMVWGKKVLEWGASPRAAFDTLIALNDRWAIDGRDPNSYSGIGWCFGRFDRPWPERPVFGKVRAMSSARAEKNLDLDQYLERWSPPVQRGLFAAKDAPVRAVRARR